MRLCRVCILAISLLFLLPVAVCAASGRHVDVIPLHADVNQVSAAYLDRGLSIANADGSSAVVIELDTPGGDLASLQNMVEHMETSRVPTIVYVYPAGAWAGSAGTFVAMAADIAAMAPGTTIGAASPVDATGGNLQSTERKKVTNFFSNYIATLARDHGHNPRFAFAAVKDAKAETYQKALATGVINFATPSLRQLLSRANDFHLKTPSGPITFHTGGAAIHYINMDFAENLAAFLQDPNLVLVLIAVGILAVIFELSSPGAVLPGVVGVISLAIAFYALGTIPINVAGLVLMGFAILLFIADIKMPTHGFLTVGGIISFFLGSLLLFGPSGASGPSLAPWAPVFVTILLAGFFGFVIRKAIAARHWRVKTGTEAFLGSTGTARTRLDPGGMVYVNGELWKAVSDSGPVEPGAEVLIVHLQGLTVHVISLAGPEPSMAHSVLAT